MNRVSRAEYHALITRVETATEKGCTEVEARGDPELVVKQVRGEYGINQPELRPLRDRVKGLAEEFDGDPTGAIVWLQFATSHMYSVDCEGPHWGELYRTNVRRVSFYCCFSALRNGCSKSSASRFAIISMLKCRSWRYSFSSSHVPPKSEIRPCNSI